MVTPEVMAEFMMSVASSSERPRSVLMSTVSAVNSYFKVIQKPTPINDDVVRLVDGLIKSGTAEPMRRSLVMPSQPFLQLFWKWGDNLNLSTWL